MKTRHILLLVGGLACLAIRPGIAAPQTFLLNDGDSIVFLGDSITQGGARPEGYVTLFELFCGVNGYEVQVINAGISGHRSNDMLARLEKDVIGHKPTWVSISCGVNDVWHNFGRDRDGRSKHRGIPLDEYKKNMTEIIEKCHAAGIKVLLLTATPIYEDIHSEENLELAKYNAFLRQLAKEKQILLCDLNQIFMDWYKIKTNDENLMTTDGVHMNPRGNRLMTKHILMTLGATPQEFRRYSNRVELVENMQPAQ